MYILGICLSLFALLAWAFGDFTIQRATRDVGDVSTMFFIAVFGAVTLLPFAYHDIPRYLAQPQTWVLLGLAALVMFFATLFDFESLKEGKIAIVEPVLGLELPVTVALSVLLIHDRLSGAQLITMFVVFGGIVFAITSKRVKFHRKVLWERGVAMAGLGAIGMGLTNFLVGRSSQETAPIFAFWFVEVVLMLLSFGYLMIRGSLGSVVQKWRRYPGLLLLVGALDNGAWVFYAYAVLYIPISIVITLTESYVALAAVLGVLVNRERLKRHQIFGAAIAIIGIIVLSAISK